MSARSADTCTTLQLGTLKMEFPLVPLSKTFPRTGFVLCAGHPKISSRRLSPLARIFHPWWIMRASLRICEYKQIYAQKHPDPRFQIWSWFEWEYAKANQGIGVMNPKITGSGD